jgi:hypothetical protein
MNVNASESVGLVVCVLPFRTNRTVALERSLREPVALERSGHDLTGSRKLQEEKTQDVAKHLPQ